MTTQIVKPSSQLNIDTPFDSLTDIAQTVTDWDYVSSKFSYSEAIDRLTDSYLNACQSTDSETQMAMTRTLNYLNEVLGIELE